MKKHMFLKESVMFLSVFSISTGATLLYYSLTQKKNINETQQNKPAVKPDRPLSPAEQLVTSLTELQQFNIDGSLNFTYGDDQLDTVINVNGSADASDFEAIKVDADLDVNVSGIKAAGKLGYYDSNIYIDYNNSHLKLPTQDALDFVDLLPSLGLNIALPEELVNLDLNKLTDDIQKMEPIEAPNGGKVFTFDLTKDIQIVFKANKDNEFTGIRTNKFFYKDLYCYANFDIQRVEGLELANPETKLDAPKYALVTPAFGLIEGMTKFFGENQNTVSVAFDLKKETPEQVITDIVKLESDVSYDTTIGQVNLSNKISENERVHDLNLQLANDTLYIDHAGLNKLSIANESVFGLINFLAGQISEAQLKALIDKVAQAMTGVDLDAMLNNILNVNNWVESLDVTENGVDVTLDLSKIITGVSKVKLSLAKDQKTFTGIHVSEFKFNGYIAKVDMVAKPYAMPTIDAQTYVAVDPAINIIPTLFNLAKQEQFRVNLTGLVDADDPAVKDVTIYGGLQFDVANMFGYGDVTIVDQTNYSHKVQVDYRPDKQILLAYNTELKAKMTAQTLTDVTGFVSELTQKNDAHFMELFGDTITLLMNSPISKVLGGDIGLLFATKGLSNFNITDTIIEMDVSGALLGLDEMNFHLAIRYDETHLYGLDITNIKMNGQTISFSADLTDFDASLEATRLNPGDMYFDLSNIRQFLELFYNTTVPNDFHITGSVNISLLGFINKALPIDIQIRNNKGKPSIAVVLPEVPLIGGINQNGSFGALTGADHRRVEVYYEDGYIYGFRADSKDKTLVSAAKQQDFTYKNDLTSFLETKNIMNFLLDFVLGLWDNYKNMVNDAINAPADPSKAPIRYELLVKDFVWNNVDNYYHIALNMAELAGNPKLNNLNANIYADMAQQIISGIQVDWNVVAGVNLKGRINLVDFNKPVDLTRMSEFISTMGEHVLNQTQHTDVYKK